MNRTTRCDCLPKWAGWSYLTRSGLPAMSCEKILLKPNNKSFIDQAFLVKMAGYWPPSIFASLWTSTSSLSINMLKKTQPLSNHTLGQ